MLTSNKVQKAVAVLFFSLLLPLTSPTLLLAATPDFSTKGFERNNTKGESSPADSSSQQFEIPLVAAPSGDSVAFQLMANNAREMTPPGTAASVAGKVKTAPVSNAGKDQKVDENTTVTLNGLSSSAALGRRLTYAWTQTAGMKVFLSAPSSATPIFSAPDVGQPNETLTFQLEVSDGIASSAPDTVNVTVTNFNKAPVSNAGTDQNVTENTVVTVNGRGSTDADGEDLIYSWKQTKGTKVNFLNPDSSSPSFTAPNVGVQGETLTFQLTVNDGIDTSLADTLNIAVVNKNIVPVSDAGKYQTPTENTLVTLNGLASSDADGEALTYAWTQVLGTKVILSDPSSSSPTFTAAGVGAKGENLGFQLIVNDGIDNSLPGTVNIVVKNLNTVPVSNAGVEQSIEENSLVTLGGLDSSDADEEELTYSWTQVAGSQVALSDPSSSSPTFTTAGVGPEGETLTFQLIVNDGIDNSLPSTVDIAVTNVNNAPVTNPGIDQRVVENALVTLSGLGSSDADGEDLTYSWTQMAGTQVVMSSLSSPSPTFTTAGVGPEGETLTFQLIVNDGIDHSLADTVNIVVENVNNAPVSNAGIPQTLAENAEVTLDGKSSSDKDGEELTYEWVQTVGTTVVLSDRSSSSPTFHAPGVSVNGETLTFQLTVNDGIDNSLPSPVNVAVTNVNNAPLSSAGIDQRVEENALVTLNGLDSSDADGEELTYSWIQTGGTNIVLSDSTSSAPTLTAPAVGVLGETLTFQLLVNDGIDTSLPATVAIVVTNVNNVPKGNAGIDQEVNENALVTLNAIESSDADGEGLTYSWTQVAGTNTVLSDSTSPSPALFAPAVGVSGETLAFQLLVNDGIDNSLADTVNVVVTNVNNAPVSNAGVEQAAEENTLVTLSGLGSSDAEGEDLTYSWTQTLGTKAVLSNPSSSSPTFTTAGVGANGETLTFQLIVNDGIDNSLPASVNIAVTNVNNAPVSNAGSHQQANENAVVTLSGLGSSDADGENLTYSWAQVAGTKVVLSDPFSSAPTFTTAGVGPEGETLAFQLIVNDGIDNSLPNSVNIVVENVNNAPVSNAGVEQTAEEYTLVTLGGLTSSDADGEELTYTWAQTLGTGVVLSDPSSSSPTFTTAGVGAKGEILTFQLIVNDGIDNSLPATVKIAVTNINNAPVSSAGIDQKVEENTLVTLNGMDSSDADGEDLTYSWTQLAGADIVLSNSTSSSPTLTTPAVGVSGETLTFQLTVNDGIDNSLSAMVDITVTNVNNVPIGNAGIDHAANENSLVTLSGVGSSDADGEDLTHFWTQVAGTNIVLSNPTSSSPTFTTPAVPASGETLTFELLVNDGIDTSLADTVNIAVTNVNTIPVSSAGIDQTVDENTTATLNALGSSDADGEDLTYSWIQTAGPYVVLSDPSSSSPIFSTPNVGMSGETLAFQLTVNDGVDNSFSDAVAIMVTNKNNVPISNAGADQVASENAVVTLSAANSADADGEPLSFLWEQISGTPVTLSNPTSKLPTFVVPVLGINGKILTFRLVVTDGITYSAPDTIAISIRPTSLTQKELNASEASL